MQTRTKNKTARLTVNLSSTDKRRAARAASRDGRAVSNWALKVLVRAVEASEQAAKQQEGGAS